MEPARRTTTGKRRVMVVADPGRESSGALQWALSHAVLENDDLVLLHVEPPSSRRSNSLSAFLKRAPSSGEDGAGAAAGGGPVEFLEEMKARCRAAQPKVKVRVERVVAAAADAESNNSTSGGMGKANAVLAQAKAQGIELLVIGQPRKYTFLGGKLSGSMSSKGIDIAEYLIENSRCLCVGVQKKGQKAGYLLNTKTHKNFWLLA